MSEIYYLIIILLLVVYIFILQNKVSRLQSKLTHFPAASMDSKLDDEVRTMLAQGKSNVEIIKHVRQAAGLDLLQAKLYVDRIMERKESGSGE
ncbi:hypothetical protein C2I18_11360 [Paenibacillus sp. PK3_47]|uniref:hypothetical protein n=1 Tax=Paenibacillus sp. PK3_47 TaxID=2072642 RepID=UPI00201E54B9|nr:hypothetical protein [Paenibacillus sp. PK3_47]UQZ34073.1 hypothetical protein C2I18_11360 [Paenibacillus sp. PK3_47]